MSYVVRISVSIESVEGAQAPTHAVTLNAVFNTFQQAGEMHETILNDIQSTLKAWTPKGD